MNSIASPQYTSAESSSSSRHYNPDSEMSRVVSSTWHVLEQTPPPTLREVLGAYNSRGDGDRDMLIAMLNAKSAEDQRMASVAALHRTLLEMQHPAPSSSHLPLPQIHTQNSRYYSHPSVAHSPPLYDQKPSRTSHSRRSSSRGDRSPYSDSERNSRKRARTAQYPASPSSSHSNESPSSFRHESPPSPQSSSRSDSADYSPRSRASMTIGSLLSVGPRSGETRRPVHHHSDSRTNSHISPTTSFGPISV